MGEDENEVTYSQEDYDLAVAEAQQKAKLGDAMQRLTENDDFKLLFQDIFIDAFAVTNVMNMAQNDEKTMKRVHDKMYARGVFSSFVHDLIEEGKAANLALSQANLGFDSEGHD